MAKIIEIGKVSSRGQIAVPADIRRALDLKDGERVVFLLEGEALLIKKVGGEKTWEEVTRPLRMAAKKSGLKEKDADRIIHEFRAKKRRE